MVRKQAKYTSLFLALLLIPYNNCSNTKSEEEGDGTLTSNGMEATISSVSAFGRVSGWAYDPSDMSRKLGVAFF